ncbi:MAG: hypothetical protein COT26_02945 [Candidatus Kerfeldbacteria bacterium CG08_land_8_20_14_0_20_43_14]|uniref:Uncharacterized protein n=1 Tax=Candidatus Kerfeldbacteria bacterium CG08_land_8_20_14_0_20_43_14 TaxID=2014246 RepID=A0A2H0YQG1_9BACT|nr:MAG: hypothetical protein COT26_02945 [Candidatus Kerfeldbacteria bacterium CG08_land_8_20_14_0_20_43_14]
MFVEVSQVGDEVGNSSSKSEDLVDVELSLQHKGYGSRAKLIKISSTHKAIVCTVCCLLVPIPITVTSYRELKEHFSLLNKPQGISINA